MIPNRKNPLSFSNLHLHVCKYFKEVGDYLGIVTPCAESSGAPHQELNGISQSWGLQTRIQNSTMAGSAPRAAQQPHIICMDLSSTSFR